MLNFANTFLQSSRICQESYKIYDDTFLQNDNIWVSVLVDSILAVMNYQTE